MEKDQQHNLYEFDDLTDFKKSIEENMIEEINLTKKLVKSLKTKNTLNKKFWENDELKPIIRKKLIHIAKDFIKQLELPKGTYIKDIILTGSIANFNWSKYSDVDLHIILDFNQLQGDPNIIKNFFQAKKNIWNEKHNIKIFNHDVELYAQDTKEPHHSSAIYSVLFDKWIKKPSKEKYSIDIPKIKEKLNSFENYLKIIKNYYNSNKFIETINLSKKLKDKIKNMRKIALEKYGESATENLIFKILRRTDFMEQLDIYKSNAYDKLMSINENSYRTLIKQKLHEMFVKKDDEEINIPYSDAEELKQAKGATKASRIDVSNKIDKEIDNAENKVAQFQNQNPNRTYFSSPEEGLGVYQVQFYQNGRIKTMQTRRPPTDIGTCKHFYHIARYCFVKAGSRFLENGNMIPEEILEVLDNPVQRLDKSENPKENDLTYIKDITNFDPYTKVKNPLSPSEAEKTFDEIINYKQGQFKTPQEEFQKFKEIKDKLQRIQTKPSYFNSPADDAAIKALTIFKDTIKSFYGKSNYVSSDAEDIAMEKMGEKSYKLFIAKLRVAFGNQKVLPRQIEAAKEMAMDLKIMPKKEGGPDLFYQNKLNDYIKNNFNKRFFDTTNKLSVFLGKADINEYIQLKEFLKHSGRLNKFIKENFLSKTAITEFVSTLKKDLVKDQITDILNDWKDNGYIKKVNKDTINAFFKYMRDYGMRPLPDDFKEFYDEYIQTLNKTRFKKD